ncbi:B12-binding domain-containing radical SAM protein [Pendulispora albinea]|uniref:Cobalamin-dependent protein n=1 Tax=Pendulispora albinea TaxID=2741071 RepID=A0ABZ2LNR3_9BACT
MRVLLVSANREKLPSAVVPLGVLSVAAAVREAHDVEVLDLCFEDDPLAVLEKTIAAVRPDVVGLGLRNLHDNTYAGSEPLLAYYEDVAACIRRATRAPFVLGGSAVTLRPTQLMERLGATHAVVGEGERTFRALLDAFARGERPDPIVTSDVIRAQSSPGKYVQIARKGAGAYELDDLPRPARDLVDPRYIALDGTASLQTKRGCAFQCTYCDYPDLEGRKVRVRAPESVVDEMEALAASGQVSHAFVVDSVFNVPRSHALAVCRAKIARNVALPWVCYVSPASLDDELVESMARAGCVGAEIGTDSGSARVLERLRKPFTLDQVRRVRAAFRAHGIADCHTFVLGAEGETAAEAERTLAFVEELDPDVAVFIAYMEDRESHGVGRAEHRQALLDLLAREAPKRAGWIVPELGIRFGAKVSAFLQKARLRGPGWVHLARARRGALSR